jgi:exosortase
LPLALFGVLWADLIRQLSYEWRTNEQYAYGWFVPFFALALFWRRWMTRPAARPQASPFWLVALVVVAAAILLPVRVVYEINPDWPLCSWLMTLTVVGISLYAVFLAGGWKWVRHFAFPVCFILVAVQWPYRIEHGLTQGLMRVVAGVTVELLGWLNIPAFQHGNLIELSTGVVGIDEACSGIRSFQSTLMAALFLGELYRLRVWARAGLVGCGLLLAFCLNVVRTLLLSWQASQHGLAILDKWHDPAGFTIAVACFFALWAIAVWLRARLDHGQRTTDQSSSSPVVPLSGSPVVPASRGLVVPGSSPRNSQPSTLNPQRSPSTPRTPRAFLVAVGCWAILCLVATEGWYRSHDIKDTGVFHWTAVAPESKPGFQKIELPPRTLKLLAFDAGSTSQWNEDDGSEFSLSFFRWNPRSVQSVIYSRVHRPEVCLPASGYKQLTESELVFFDAGQFKLPFRKYTYASEGQILYVFFCQWEDGAETQTGMGASGQTERLRSVWVGRRLVGQQTLEIIITGSPSLAEAEALVRRRLPELIRPDAAQAQPKRISGRAP